MAKQIDDITAIERQLGRAPDGFQEVVCRNVDGLPAIIRVASMVNGEPFPTLFWLCDSQLSKLVYHYESNGTTQLIQEQIDGSPELQDGIRRDNLDHIRLRESYYSEEVQQEINRLDLESTFAKKGIGGNSNFLRVRCLHANLAAHLVAPNTVGDLIAAILGPEDPLVIALDQIAESHSK